MFSLDFSDSNIWTPHKVELALWTFCVAKQLKPELLSELDYGSKSKTDSDKREKRKSSETNGSTQKKTRR